MGKKLVQGVGINDAEYVIQTSIRLEERLANGQRKQKVTWSCPYYVKWSGMLERCYSTKTQEIHPTYKGCTVCKEWLTFSNFRKWMVTQDWEGMQLDKDLLFKGNKVYSPETAVFVSNKINNFILTSGGARGNYLIGCSWDKSSESFKAEVNIPSLGKRINLGRYNTEIEAHLVWKKRKHELACELADSEYVTEPRVAEALRSRFVNYNVIEDWCK